MSQHLRANLWLLISLTIVGSILYPLGLWAFGQAFFRDKAQGSLILDKEGNPVGSRLIAQPFTGDGYFWPRPSAASYNGAASGASNWGANNSLLRNRVARQLGPVVKYGGSAQKGRLVGPDIEHWFQKDLFQKQPGIVAQWAQAHPGLAQAWVKADALHAEYVKRWLKSSRAENQEANPEDMAVPFFVAYSHDHPGAFPGVVERETEDGKSGRHVGPVKTGADIQSTFFEMWLLDHPRAELEPVPADMVMASGSGLDPHITLKNALYQLDRVAGTWAKKTSRKQVEVRKEIEDVLRAKTETPLGGLAGVDIVNVLEVNLALREHFGAATESQ